MGLYEKYILPGAIDWACSQKTSMQQREKVIPLATGRVLEIGIGSGFNLSFYDGSRVTHLTAIDPLEELWEKRRVDLEKLEFEVTYIKGLADPIPAENNTFDTVVTTYTLCTIKRVDSVLKEIHRVLKSNGKLIFSEHGKAPDKGLERVQNLINPFWRRVGGGCNLNRDIPAMLERNGFKIDCLDARYLSGWRPASYNYWGSASKI